MILQKDRYAGNKTYTREEAEWLLANPVRPQNNSAPDVMSRFATYDTTQYEKHVDANYSQGQGHQGQGDPGCNNNSGFDQYVKPESKYPQEISTPVTPQFESYVNTATQTRERAAAEPTQTFAPFGPKSNFKPTIYTHNFQKVDEDEMAQAANLEKIAEVQIVDEQSRPKSAETEHELHDQMVRLNTRGKIAVASFFAILALVIVLVIINAVSIGSSGAALQSLRSENAALNSNLNTTIADRNAAQSNITDELNNYFNTPGNSVTINGQEYVRINNSNTNNLPNLNSWQRPSNPDSRTNWFDRLSAWLSGLFR